MTTIQNWISMAGSHSIIFIQVTRMYTIQLFIHTLSYKNIILAAVVYCVHFLLSWTNLQVSISRNLPIWDFEQQEKHIPKLTCLSTILKYGRPLCSNLYLSLFAMEGLVFSLSLMMAIENSFYILVSDAVFAAINIFFILTLVWYFNTELFLSRYLRFQVGYHLGVLVSVIVLALPVIRYEHIFVAANLHKAISVNLAIIPLFCVIALSVRLIRWCHKNSKVSYSPLTVGPKQGIILPRKRRVQKPTDSALLESYSSEEEDIL